MENVLISKKHTDVMDFQCNRFILVRLWVKIFLLQGWIQAEIPVHIYTIILCLFHACNLGHFQLPF